MSGLTLGLLGMDVNTLEILRRQGTPTEVRIFGNTKSPSAPKKFFRSRFKKNAWASPKVTKTTRGSRVFSSFPASVLRPFALLLTSFLSISDIFFESQILYATRLLPIVRRHHLLLVTLLLCNAGCMEALPIFLEKMMPDYLAIIVSVTAVLFFGEYVAFKVSAFSLPFSLSASLVSLCPLLQGSY